jgi:hypothetical protein
VAAIVSRWRRILWHFLAAVSFSFVIAAVTLWLWSYRVTQTLRWADQNAWQCWMVGRGQVMYLRAVPPESSRKVSPEPFHRQVEQDARPVTEVQWLVKDFARFAGFAFGRGDAPDYRGWAAVVPLWFACGVFVVVPWMWWQRWRGGAFGRAPGVCARCGYDLRATPERCPECGAVPVP